MNTAQKIAELVKKVGTSIQVFKQKRVLWFFKRNVDLGKICIEDVGEYWYVDFTDARPLHQSSFSLTTYSVKFHKDSGEPKDEPIHGIGLYTAIETTRVLRWTVNEERKIKKISDLIVSKIDLAYKCNLEVPK